MVKLSKHQFKESLKNSVKADVIILGCSLPGIVTAHKLKKRFGNSIDVMVLDLMSPPKNFSRYDVTFQEKGEDDEDDISEHSDDEEDEYKTARQLIDNVARYYLATYARDFHLPLPESIMSPHRVRSPLNKLFQHQNGNAVQCNTDFFDFQYLGFVEKFELNQYNTLLDQNMKDLFATNSIDMENDRLKLLYYDQTTMEQHICNALLFTTSRDIMRMTVRLVCGASASIVSVLFYLHQCYRTNSSSNHLGGSNTRFREKLLGYCKKRLAVKLQESVADITMPENAIKQIRTCADEHVILETKKGGTIYECNLLAVALQPNELIKIQVEDHLLSKTTCDAMRAMVSGYAKKFLIQYEENFWSRQGYSGDILSLRGPIVWAMERPSMSSTGSKQRYAALVGYLMVRDCIEKDSQEEVIEQLVSLFGNEAATPASYKESYIADVFVPRCGDYIGIRKLTEKHTPTYLEWASLDIFAEGDIAAALEAGHTAYLHLLSCLRPQAQTYEDLSTAGMPSFFNESSIVVRTLANINVINAVRWSIYFAVSYMALRFVKSIIRK